MDLTSDQLLTWGGTVVRLSVLHPGSCELVGLLTPTVGEGPVRIDGTVISLPDSFFELSGMDRAQAVWTALQFKTGEPWTSARARRAALKSALASHAPVEDRAAAYAKVGVDLLAPGDSPLDRYRHMALGYEDLAPVADLFADALRSEDSWRAAVFIRPMLEAAMREGMDRDLKSSNRTVLANSVVSNVAEFAARSQ